MSRTMAVHSAINLCTFLCLLCETTQNDQTLRSLENVNDDGYFPKFLFLI